MFVLELYKKLTKKKTKKKKNEYYGRMKMMVKSLQTSATEDDGEIFVDISDG